MAPSSLIRRMTVSSSSWVQLTKMLYRNSDHFTALAGPTLVGEILRPLSHPDDGQGGRNAAGPQPLRLSAQAFGERGGHWRPLPKLCHQVYLPITDS